MLGALPNLRRQLADKHLGLVIKRDPTSRGGDIAAIEQQEQRDHRRRRFFSPEGDTLLRLPSPPVDNAEMERGPHLSGCATGRALRETGVVMV
ncbi:MAG: hypothetical protein M3433_07850 [Actinomycetota bacterium]|nr:hypothetical protein [Actinomycetota bacterium]MDQ3648480.1 hypothetical protein [Actinomycetota bacterium]